MHGLFKKAMAILMGGVGFQQPRGAMRSEESVCCSQKGKEKNFVSGCDDAYFWATQGKELLLCSPDL